MKTKSLLLLILFMGFPAVQALAQGKNAKSVQYKTELGYFTPVYCGDVVVDYVEGVVMFHIIDHYKNGEWKWEIAQAKGEAMGQYGEVFKVREVDKYYIPKFGILTWHYNLIGNKGNHYIGSLTYNFITGELTVDKTVCH